MRVRAKQMVSWVTCWGIATLVALSAFAAAYVASNVDLPRDIPSFAPRAVPVSRVEVGASGVKVQDIRRTPEDQEIEDFERRLSSLKQMAEVIDAKLRSAVQPKDYTDSDDN